MSRDIEGKELGLDLFLENGDDPGARILLNTGVPGGDSSFQDAAPVPSLYFRVGTPEVYKKISNVNNSSADWELVTSNNLLAGFRNDLVRAVTSDAAPGAFPATINLSTTPFGDDEGTQLTAADFAVDERVIFGCGGTPVIARVTSTTATGITVDTAGVTALADNDSFVVRNFLPDSPDNQEGQALVLYNGTDCIKLADVNWNFADGITLNGFTPQAGAILGTDSVQVALEKLQFQINNFSAGNDASLTGVTGTYTTLDTCLVDEAAACEWDVTAELASDTTRRRTSEVKAIHNGTTSADATDVKDRSNEKFKIGAGFNFQTRVVLEGTGAAQTMSLQVRTTSPGINVYSRRTDVKF